MKNFDPFLTLLLWPKIDTNLNKIGVCEYSYTLVHPHIQVDKTLRQSRVASRQLTLAHSQGRPSDHPVPHPLCLGGHLIPEFLPFPVKVPAAV